MYEHASVVSLENGQDITVACQTDSCANCKAGSFCSAKGKTFIAQNSADLELHPGDTVELYLPPGKTVFSGFIALLVPLMLFPAGYYAPLAFTASPPEGVKIALGIVGMAVGFVISRIFSRVKAREYTPEITRVVRDDEQEEGTIG